MGETNTIVIIIIFNLFFVLFIVAIITFIRQYKIKKKEHIHLLLHQNTEHQREILATQIEMQQQTMQHIGREIHDNIGQKLTLASLYTQQLAFENKAPQINENIENISNIINTSLSELRQLSKTLTDNSIETNSIFLLIQTECQQIKDFKKCAFNFNNQADQVQLSYQSKNVLLRIVQEFLQNSIKHSNCKLIEVSLSKFDTVLELILQDDGCGFDISKINNNGIGLSNMKKRTEIIGGIFLLESNKNGTKITITIPLLQ